MFEELTSPYRDGIDDGAGGPGGAPSGAGSTEPGGGQITDPGGKTTEPTSYTPDQFKAIQARATRAEQAASGIRQLTQTVNKLAQLMSQQTSTRTAPPSPGAGGGKPSLDLPEGVKSLLGNDSPAFVKFFEQMLESKLGNFIPKDKLATMENQQDTLQFYQNYPGFSPFRPMIDQLNTAFDSGELSRMPLMALAARGMMTEKIVEERVKAELAKAEGEWKKKHLAGVGPGGGSINPALDKTQQEAKEKESRQTFSLSKKPTYTNVASDD
uniref:Uncharacterized protein n=1 Tax=viral metagenome TaxID=1070528 RepID=A0A6M3ISU5_9ZZZZ